MLHLSIPLNQPFLGGVESILGKFISAPSDQLPPQTTLCFFEQTLVTKNGDDMAFLDLEDETGKVDVTVFPRTYEQVKSLLEDGALVLAIGKTQNRDGKIQLVADKLMKVEVDVSVAVLPVAVQKHDEEFVSEKPMLNEATSIVVLQLTLEEVEDVKRLENLRGILQEYSGNLESAKMPVGAMVVGEHHRQLVRFPRSFWVKNPEVLVNRLRGQDWNVEVLALGDSGFASVRDRF